ncbi:hypothetical protein AtNW77_Chr2g0250831 [Arabidopsis thaliana]|uniref:Uncharacterized protein n=4 Tax=Arabidopsis TaxID=3701 RepID=A0A178VZE3_ARATH|nr:unknown [Arabidopsis thaliana]KAG7638027.1 hypothetical protein ISN45_At02g025110 [Arabidopsis thaliana x Arabidopsis arenosa]KAG7642652.1 hypothetical protein ISN44_As02g025430 [Arabidopsis suecica]OAP10625.1 hypothetical protein AXX17_AT2G27050 [Arabidopsis thaliana]CAA0373717.1 unnamed protein product [Arabidopsis thaliana]
MAQFLEKATSALSEAKESVTSTAESVTASLTDAEKTVNQTARSTLTDAETTVAASVETVKTEAAAAPDKASGVSTQAKDAVDKAFSRGIEGAKSLLQTFEAKSSDISSKLVGGVTNLVSGASSSTVANRDLPVSTDNQPLLASGETTPWWKNCCGVLDLFKKDT